MELSTQLPLHRIVYAALMLVAAAVPGRAWGAVPDLYCAGEGAGPAPHASSEQLRRAASDVEEQLRLAQGRAIDFARASKSLEVARSAAEPPASSAQAEYCAAAGEVMRVSSQGSQLQAQTYLINAARHGLNSGTGAVVAKAAYRLGLVSLAGPSVAGGRGARRSRGGSSEVAQTVREAKVPATDSCGGLRQQDLLNQSNAYISVVALGCAAERGQGANDSKVSALASLRLARLGLSLVDADPATSDQVRQEAFAEVLAAIPVAGRIEDSRLRAELLGRLIATGLDLRPAAHPALATGIAAMRQSGPDDPAALSFAAALEARLALAAADPVRARDHLGRAILHESQRPLPARLPEWYLLLAQADASRREQHVHAAFSALESLRPLLPRIDPLTEESTFSLHMRQVFESAVDVQLASAGGGQEEVRIRGAQQIVEAYRQAELQSIFGSECIPPRDPLTPEQLVAGEILLYPILLHDRVELIYVAGTDLAKGDVRYRRLPPNRSVNRTSVSRLVEKLVLPVSVGATDFGGDDEWRAPARQLYDLLIKPIEGSLVEGSQLVIVPDGALRAVPFGALLAGDGKFLVQKTRLAIAPSLAYSQPGRARGDDQPSVVAASLQREVALPAGTFSKLEGTREEARIAAGEGAPHLGGTHIEDFRKADLIRALSGGEVDVLHLATHASFNGRSDRAFIVANGEVILLSELRELIARNRARGDDLDLLVLSACETAVGDDEASMGLAGAAVQAGALSALASLWQVNDAGTAELMKRFYGGYRSGRSRSEALRDAQLAAIEGGGANANPNIWAAFILLGAWR
ncbi:MAG TPA: CHAT domain-containing protein [Allosphingosinicella sp.]|nr:CHAT domain-containing protein [Allosphingosinicella sp.]